MTNILERRQKQLVLWQHAHEDWLRPVLGAVKVGVRFATTVDTAVDCVSGRTRWRLLAVHIPVLIAHGGRINRQGARDSLREG
jgi:hypothetical protein